MFNVAKKSAKLNIRKIFLNYERLTCGMLYLYKDIVGCKNSHLFTKQVRNIQTLLNLLKGVQLYE